MEPHGPGPGIQLKTETFPRSIASVYGFSFFFCVYFCLFVWSLYGTGNLA